MVFYRQRTRVGGLAFLVTDITIELEGLILTGKALAPSDSNIPFGPCVRYNGLFTLLGDVAETFKSVLKSIAYTLYFTVSLSP